MNKTIWALAFVVLACGVSFAMDNATAQQQTQSGFEGTTTAGQITTEGGNVTNVTLGTNASTEKWAGFYGTLTGQLVLAEAGTGPYMYSWDFNVATGGGTVCTSVHNNPTWSSPAAAITRAAIDHAWGFVTGDTDSASNTMSDAGATVIIHGAASEASANVTTAGDWNTVAVNTSSGSGIENVAFCVDIANKAAFQGATSNFQIMAAVTEGAGVGPIDTYYFYMELI